MINEEEDNDNNNNKSYHKYRGIITVLKYLYIFGA